MPPEITAPNRARASEPGSVEGALQLLARAVRNFHTYPATSPLCAEAVTACHEALRSLPHGDRVAARVTPHDLIVDEVHVGARTIIEHELTRRLFKLRVASIEIDCGSEPRDLSRFCLDLVESDDPLATEITFAERLIEHGIDTIVPTMARKPVVMDVGVPAPQTQGVIAHERLRREASTPPDAPVSYLYPPDRGWIRLDPGQPMAQVSLVDLVLLVEDPADIASMLVRLTDDDSGGPDGAESALERKYSDVTRLFSALDPRLAQVMFSKLARAVLNLVPERRNSLLQRTILPGLLDGRADGNVLREFPDMDLAESICLLLDLEAAAPEVLSTALNRLDLTTDRRATLVPLIEDRMRTESAGRAGADGAAEPSGIERYARALIRVDSTRSTDFTDFAAFDLSLDAQVGAAVVAVRDGIGATDMLNAQLLCVSQLVRIERNPSLVEAFLRRAFDLLGALERAGRSSDVIAAARGYAELGMELQVRRPDVAVAISKALGEFCTPDRMLALADLLERDDESRAVVEKLVRALGASCVPGFVALMNRPVQHQKAKALTQLMCELAPTVATALSSEIDSCSGPAARVVVKILGYAGAGHEAAVVRLVEHQHHQVAREALRSLARIGTTTAAVLVARQIREGTDDTRAAAEDAMWHFPAAQAATQVRELLRSREFVLQHPETAVRLIERAGQARMQGLDEALAKLERLRFRFWKPSLRHVALKAREVRAR